MRVAAVAAVVVVPGDVADVPVGPAVVQMAECGYGLILYNNNMYLYLMTSWNIEVI